MTCLNSSGIRSYRCDFGRLVLRPEVNASCILGLNLLLTGLKCDSEGQQTAQVSVSFVLKVERL